MLQKIMDVIGMLKELFGMNRALSEERKQKTAINNTPEMTEAANRVNITEEEDRIKNNVAKGDLGEIRKDHAE